MKQAIFGAMMVRDLAEVLPCSPAEIPPVFSSDEPRPLKIQIHEDLLARFPGADSAKISRWLKLWTRRVNYFSAVAYGPFRFDLDGNLAGEVTPDEKAHARKQIAGDRKAAKKAKAKAKAARAETPVPVPAPEPKRTGQNGRPILSLPFFRRASCSDQ